MRKKLTSINRSQLSYALLSLFFVLLLDDVRAQAPYCAASHTKSCSSHNMHIGAVQIKEINTVIYNKASDGCNQSSSPNYTLISTSPSFSLSEGCMYSISFTTGNTYNVQVGVWIDLNRDNDFADTGEFVSKGWADISAGSNLQARTLILACSSIKAGTSRMRIRTDSAGSTPWNSGASCSTVKYGETEDYTITLDTSGNPAAFYTTKPDTFYVGVPVYFTNKNRKLCASHQWDIEDNGSSDYTSIDAAHVFHTPGKHCVRLKTDNCKGRTDYTRCLNVLTAPISIKQPGQDKAFQIYPNPSTGIVNISSAEPPEIRVYNALGEIIMAIEPTHAQNGVYTIDLGNEASGLYTLRIRSGGKEIMRKLAVMVR